MSAEENKGVVRRWIEAYNDRDTQAEADARAPGYVTHTPGLPGTVEDIFSEGDMVAARIAFHGTHRGEFQGIPPTEKRVTFSGIEIDRMVDGKVQEHWFEMDLLGLMQQLGAIPEPEQSEGASPT